MAIKTKKISELTDITNPSKETVVVGVNSGTTGKISLGQILDMVEFPEQEACEVTQEEYDELVNRVATCETKLPAVDSVRAEHDELAASYTGFVDSQTIKNGDYEAKHSAIDGDIAELRETCERLSASLEETNNKVKQLEGFVHSLQQDGYLTLANIKKAAAEHCPCGAENHDPVQDEPAAE
jgi:hypothetical protein